MVLRLLLAGLLCLMPRPSLAAGISSRNDHVGPCLDAINTWYGRPDVPIGYQRGSHRYLIERMPRGAGPRHRGLMMRPPRVSP